MNRGMKVKGVARARKARTYSEAEATREFILLNREIEACEACV